MNLESFDNSDYQRGRPWPVEALWRILAGLFFESWIPGSGWRVGMLRLFGARLGKGIIIKPRVRIKFPWKLRVGDFSWIGEDVWIDNLADVQIGNNCCISQGAYLCTGNHRWDEDAFSLVTLPINIKDSCWIGAKAKIAPGVSCESGSVLSIGSTATTDLQEWSIYSGTPAIAIKSRPRPQGSVQKSLA